MKDVKVNIKRDPNNRRLYSISIEDISIDELSDIVDSLDSSYSTEELARTIEQKANEQLSISIPSQYLEAMWKA